MKTAEFMDRLSGFARNSLSAKCASPMTKMLIGASTCGIGRKIMDSKLVPILDMCVVDGGDLDLEGIRESVEAGMSAAGSVPVLGGAISIDLQDAREFFGSLVQ